MRPWFDGDGAVGGDGGHCIVLCCVGLMRERRTVDGDGRVGNL